MIGSWSLEMIKIDAKIKKRLNSIFNTFGQNEQHEKTREELDELNTAIINGNIDEIREELADVIVLCMQLRLFYGEDIIDNMVMEKIFRTESRILTNFYNK
jgi:NTP pyrophosphatase (non-canonical NTP hydrolase)